MDFLRLDFSVPPVAHVVWGEVAPGEVLAGMWTTLTYAVRAHMEDRDTGFDVLEIDTPSEASVQSLDIDGQSLPTFLVEVGIDHLKVAFPEHPIRRDNALLRLTFQCRVLSFGTRFTGRVYHSRTGELPQQIVPGDASPDLETNDLMVAVQLSNRILWLLGASPNPFTPNGDGRGDETTIEYRILKVIDPAPVILTISTLSGRLINTLYRGEQGSGIHAVMWDGRDHTGRLVRPGTYICEARVEAEIGTSTETMLIAVVY
jgi:hypothetical protein